MKTFLKPLTAREERECLERLKEGDQEAKSTLILRNMRLVAHVVKKYQGTDHDMECYEISDVVLSNLEDSGILFGYVSEPHPVIF